MPALVRKRPRTAVIPHVARYDQVLMAMFRFMVIDEDGRRVGRFDSDDPNWHSGDTFTLDEQLLRIVEILPEVSTMVAYNAVWVATPATDEDIATGSPARRIPDSTREARV